MGRIFNDVWQRMSTDPFLLTWNAVSAASVILPLLIFWIARATYQNYDENGNNNNNDQNDGGGSQDEYYYRKKYGYYDEYGYWHEPKRWYQFWKSNNEYRDGGGQGGSQDGQWGGAPWWCKYAMHLLVGFCCSFSCGDGRCSHAPFVSVCFRLNPNFIIDFGGNQREGAGAEEENKGCLIFVFIWSIVTLTVVSYYVHKLVMQGNTQGTRWLLLGFANYCFMVCVLLGGLEAIKVEGREIEETGWYGQTSVLVFLMCLFNIFSAIGFTVWSINRQRKQQRLAASGVVNDSENKYYADEEANNHYSSRSGSGSGAL